MGSIRSLGFDVVIDVGGKSQESRSGNFDGRENWIGIGSHRKVEIGKRVSETLFDHLLLLEEIDSALQEIALKLARRLYDQVCAT